jgi:hypothetical protein
MSTASITKDRGKRMVGVPPVTDIDGIICKTAINMKYTA